MVKDVLEKSFGNRKIFLRDKEGQLLPATVELGCKDWSENNQRNTECRIKLTWSGGEIECIAGIFFESFKRDRNSYGPSSEDNSHKDPTTLKK